MTPLTQTTPVLKESARIKHELLKVQAEIEAVTQAAEAKLTAATRRQLGYEEKADPGSTELVDTRVTGKTTVLTPKLLSDVLPVSKRSARTTKQSRQAISNILRHKDDRLIVI